MIVLQHSTMLLSGSPVNSVNSGDTGIGFGGGGSGSARSRSFDDFDEWE